MKKGAGNLYLLTHLRYGGAAGIIGILQSACPSVRLGLMKLSKCAAFSVNRTKPVSCSQRLRQPHRYTLLYTVRLYLYYTHPESHVNMYHRLSCTYSVIILLIPRFILHTIGKIGYNITVPAT